MKSLFLLILCSLTCLTASAEPLKATIEHSEHVSALPPALAPGNQFVKERLYQPVSDEWVVIPEWYAGEFKSTESLIVSVTDLKTGQKNIVNRRDDPHGLVTQRGCQRDAKGNYWELLEIGKRKKYDLPGRVQYGVDESVQMQTDEQGNVIALTRGPAAIVNPTDGQILKSNMLEQITKTKQVEGGALATTSIVEFDSAGNPEVRTLRKTKQIKVGPFKEAPETRESFERYCKQNNIPF